MTVLQNTHKDVRRPKPASTITNRDIRRQNPASTVVLATLFSNVVREGLITIDKITTSMRTSTDINFLKRGFTSIASINDVIRSANETSMKEYCRCSTHIKQGAISIANRETQLIKQAIRTKELHALEIELRHFNQIVVDSQISISSAFHNTTHDHSSSHVEFVPTQRSATTTNPQSAKTKPVVRFNKTISKFKRGVKAYLLPPPTIHFDSYSPMQAIQVVLANSDNSNKAIIDLPKENHNYVIRKMSRSLVIKLMIAKKYIPVNKSKMYRLLTEYQINPTSIPKWWHSSCMRGPKHHLDHSTLDEMTDELQKSTEGGRVMSKDDLKRNLNEKIIQDREKKTGLKYSTNNVPESTLRRYVNEVVSQYEFNMFNSVCNKTESRSVAELSICSTVSFLLVLLTTHFIRAKPTMFHKPQKEMEKNKTWKLVNDLNKKILGIQDSIHIVDQFIHVLPHLITSTDECSLFITTQIINKKLAWHFSTRPKIENKPTEDSSKRNVFSTTLSGDAHLRGVRISLNNTFTAGGRSAPIFACVYGLTLAEMPKDEIVVLEIPGLVPASNQNGSKEIGFIVFVRGSDPTYERNAEYVDDEDSVEDNTYFSKDAKIAKLYRDKVFYPLIEDIRRNYYMMPELQEGEEVPSSYTAVSWMDGCHGQLSMTTQEDVLKLEKSLKIISCKHSAARTAVEQPADAGCMFKTMKGVIKQMPTESVTVSPIFFRITEGLKDLENPTSLDECRVVKLAPHKKKAIIAGVSKLPVAMSTAFKEGHIQSAFRATGHIDKEGILPSVENIIGTYRGVIDDTNYLNDSDNIIKTFYDDVYLNGRIEEDAFERQGVVRDYDSAGNYVTRDFEISKENCQRSKILSSKIQREERLKLMKSIKQKQIEKQTSMYDTESKKYKLNDECNDRVVGAYYAHLALQQLNNIPTPTNENVIRKTFIELAHDMQHTHFGRNSHKGFSVYKPTMDQMKAFIQLRNKVTKFQKNRPVYKKLEMTKDELIDECMLHLHIPLESRLYEQPPIIEDNTNTA